MLTWQAWSRRNWLEFWWNGGHRAPIYTTTMEQVHHPRGQLTMKQTGRHLDDTRHGTHVKNVYGSCIWATLPNPLKTNHVHPDNISYGPIIGNSPFLCPAFRAFGFTISSGHRKPKASSAAGPWCSDSSPARRPSSWPKPWGEPNESMKLSPSYFLYPKKWRYSFHPPALILVKTWEKAGKKKQSGKKNALKEYSMLNYTTYHWRCTSQPFPRCSSINQLGLCSQRSFRNKMASLRRCLSSHGRAPLRSLEPEPVWYRYEVVDLALNQAAKPLETNINIRLGTICSGLFPVCNLEVSTGAS